MDKNYYYMRTHYGEWYLVNGVVRNGYLTYCGPERGDDGHTTEYLTVPEKVVESKELPDDTRILSFCRNEIKTDRGTFSPDKYFRKEGLIGEKTFQEMVDYVRPFYTCEKSENAGNVPGLTLFITKLSVHGTLQLYQNEATALYEALGKALGR